MKDDASRRMKERGFSNRECDEKAELWGRGKSPASKTCQSTDRALFKVWEEKPEFIICSHTDEGGSWQ